jgi:hypothetical protein
MADPFPYTDSVTAPARKVVAVAPHDSNPLPDVSKALYVGTAGDVVLQGVGGGPDVTLKNVPAGTVLAIRATHVRNTGTSAQNIVAFV